MNISQAKEIPLSVIVEALGGTYSHSTRSNKEHWYYSPFREERTASFKIDERTNKWHDFGLAGNKQGNGGDAIDLWCDYHRLDRKTGVKEALQGLQAYSNAPITSSQQRTITRLKKAVSNNAAEITTDQPRFQILKLHKKIVFPQIIAEAQRRKISLEVANLYLKQVYLKDSENPNRHMNGLAFANMQGGYEISIPHATGKSFKTSTRPKAPSFIKGKDSSRIEIFEGFWDFLSLLEMQKTTIPNYDCYVLNSVSLARFVINEIKRFKDNIQSIMLYLDNDNAGQQTTRSIIEDLEAHIPIIGTKEQLYKGYRDLNDWWTCC